MAFMVFFFAVRNIKLRNRVKPTVMKIKREKPTIDFVVDTTQSSSTDKNNIPEYKLSGLNLKTEDFSDNNFIGKPGLDQSQTISTSKRANQINDDAVQNAKYIKTEIKQEETLKSEVLTNSISGKYDMVSKKWVFINALITQIAPLIQAIEAITIGALFVKREKATLYQS